jgi:hypothetical protein
MPKREKVACWMHRLGGRTTVENELLRYRYGSCANAFSWRCSCERMLVKVLSYSRAILVKDRELSSERKGVKRTGWCCQFGGESTEAQGGSASAPWQASAWFGKTCGSVGEESVSDRVSWEQRPRSIASSSLSTMARLGEIFHSMQIFIVDNEESVRACFEGAR